MNRKIEDAEIQEFPVVNEPEVQCNSTAITVYENRKKAKILLAEPETPISYWSYDHTLPLIDKKAAYPPLGLITLAAMLPEDWELSLADSNTGTLTQESIERSDAVFIGGMHIQRHSFHELVERAHAAGKTVVGGGPYVTSSPNECQDLDHLVLGEVEGGIEEWSWQFEQGIAPKVAQMPPFPSLDKTKIPRFDLIDPKDYASVGLQLSRGCPHDCEFCSVTKLNGRRPRLKGTKQFLEEAEVLRQNGFRGSAFVVDDNFIGNHKAVEEMLPALAAWQKKHGYPLDFFTQADLRLAKFDSLMEKMVDAGFSGVFLGIETPSKEALKESGKHQNTGIDLDAAVKKIAEAGLEPMAGFIMGFDSDKEEDLDALQQFINRNPIPHAMVGVLQAIPKTDLHARMKKEGRLLREYDGDQFGTANFETVIDPAVLRGKYAEVLRSIYSPKNYFDRCLHLMRLRDNPRYSLYRHKLKFGLNALKNSIVQQGLCSDYRARYWQFLSRVAVGMTDKIHAAVTYAAKFHHYYRYTQEDVLPRLAQ
ncbi:MAG: B12-binding domain-containing radical SAM protein [Patescibacteria group bacterium]